MEKSMIQDLRNSGASPMRKSTFTTSYHDNNLDLRRSKISNLPSYKKSNLSDRLPFVVVFQTIEIERLSEEIETLRVELKDSQRQAFNCQSYEIQIRQLTDQCHNYDMELSQYKQEVEKLNDIAQQLYDELEAWKEKYSHLDPMISEKYESKIEECEGLESELQKWKNRYKGLETSKDKELQDLKLAMESQRQSMLDREIRQLSIKYQTQRSHLENQIRKLQQISESKDHDITSLNYQIQALRIENDANQEANHRLRESENKLNRIADENIQLNQILRKKQEQIQKQEEDENFLKKLLAELERQKKQISNQVVKIPGLENELREWTIKYSRLENDYIGAVELANTIPNLESNIKACEIENHRLGNLIKQKINEVSDREREIQRCRALIDESRKNSQIIPVLQRKIVQLNYELDRMNEQLKNRLIEIEDGKSKISVLQKTLKFHEDAEPQRRRVQQNFKRQVKQIDNNQKVIDQMSKQLEKIPHLQNTLQQEKVQKKQYQTEIERLNRVIKQKTCQVEKYANKCEHLTSQIQKLSALQKQLHNYKTQNNKMTQQIDKLAGIIKQKTNQLQNLKQVVIKIQNDVGKYKEIQQKLTISLSNTEKLMKQLSNTKGNLQKCENNLLESQFALRQAKSNIIEINQQKQLIMRNLKTKTQEHEAAVQEIKQIERRNKQLQSKLRKAKEQYQNILKKLQNSEQNLKKQKLKVKQLDRKCHDLENVIEKMKIKGHFPTQFRDGFEKLKKKYMSEEEEIKKMKKKQSELQKCIKSISTILTKCHQKYSNGQSSFQILNQKIDKSFGYIDRIAQLEQQNNCLRNENCELQSQLKIMNLELVDLEHRKKSSSVSQFTIAPSLMNMSTRKTLQSLHDQKTHSKIDNQQFNKSYLTFDNKSLAGTSRAIQTGSRTTSNYQDFKSKFEHPPRSSSRSIRTKITSIREPLGESKYSFRG